MAANTSHSKANACWKANSYTVANFFARRLTSSKQSWGLMLFESLLAPVSSAVMGTCRSCRILWGITWTHRHQNEVDALKILSNNVAAVGGTDVGNSDGAFALMRIIRSTRKRVCRQDKFDDSLSWIEKFSCRFDSWIRTTNQKAPCWKQNDPSHCGYVAPSKLGHLIWRDHLDDIHLPLLLPVNNSIRIFVAVRSRHKRFE